MRVSTERMGREERANLWLGYKNNNDNLKRRLNKGREFAYIT